MGLETIIFAGLTAFKAINSITTANSQAKNITKNATNQAQATIDAGNIAAANKAKEIRAAAARQTVSFLNSGLTLEGSPGAIIDETYTTGATDLAQLSKNYNTSSDNIISAGNAASKQAISAGRSAAIGDIVSGFGSYAGSSSLFSGLTESAGQGLNSLGFGNDAYDLISANDKAMGYY